jgi:hypothetical protein
VKLETLDGPLRGSFALSIRKEDRWSESANGGCPLNILNILNILLTLTPIRGRFEEG